MKESFLGIGRTWTVIIAITAGATALHIWGQLAVDQWIELVKWLVGFGAGKSSVQQVATRIGRRSDPTT